MTVVATIALANGGGIIIGRASMVRMIAEHDRAFNANVRKRWHVPHRAGRAPKEGTQAMKAYAFAALAAISAASLAGCNASQQATVTQVASDACLVLQAVSASALSLPAKGTASVNAGVAACSAISNGTSINLASDTAAAIAAVLTFAAQELELIPAAKALAPDARLAKHRLELDYANARAFGFVH